MKLCAVSESLGHLSFKEAARASADLGLAGLEIGMGNWSAAPHADLPSLLQSKEKRLEFLSGHGEQWWREFCYRLRLNGYDAWLSIEHEDVVLSRMEGMRRSIDLLNRTFIDEPSDYTLPTK